MSTLKIKVKLFNKNCRFEVISKGDWIDLKAACDYKMQAPYTKPARKEKNRIVIYDNGYIPLGIGMKIPEGYEVHVLPRSSTFKKFGITMSNSEGIIDGGTYGYCGPNDQWHFPAIAFKDTHIKEGDRICQFKIKLSQKATMWQKIKWLFTSKIKFEFVDDYEGEDRGGFGSTGV